MKIFDTPGAPEFDSMKELDYSGADACILVYSIDKDSSFECLDKFRNDCLEHAPKCKMFICGNKVDLDADGYRQV